MSASTLADQFVNHVVMEHETPKELHDLADLFILDYLGVTVGGLDRESARAVREACALSDTATPAAGSLVLGAGLWAGLEDAALINGVTSHGLELDDTHEMASMHPGVAILPALFAFVDNNPVSRDEFDRAMLVAYDVMTALGTYLGAAESYGRGFHPTGVCGAVGASAGVAVLMKLNTPQTLNALSLAANMASGSLEFLSDGSWTKRLNAGNAAATGLRAAKLARAGFTAPATFLEGRDGFLRQYGQGLITGRELNLEFGRGIRDTSIKLYPCCRYTHGNIDLLTQVHAEYPDLSVSDIAEIECAVIDAGSALVSLPAERKLVVETAVDAQFNMPFAAALAITSGTATVEQFDSGPANAQTLLPLMKRVNCVRDDDVEAVFPQQWHARVRVTLVDGSVIERRTSAFKGSPLNPASLHDVQVKAAGLVSPEWAARAVQALHDSRGAAQFTSSLVLS